MVSYSVIIPQRDRADEVRRQLLTISGLRDQLGVDCEIVIVDDGSSATALRSLEKLTGDHPFLRILRFNRPVGVSVALSTGIRAARGEMIVVIGPGDTYPARQIPELISFLKRADLVVGRRQRNGFAKLWHRLSRIPRGLLLGLESHDPECLFWAARREALADIALEAGMARYLPAFVARRGFRVCEKYVDDLGPRQPLDDVRPHPLDLLTAWWRCRRWREQTALELPSPGSMPALRIIGADHSNPADAHLSPVLQQAKSA